MKKSVNKTYSLFLLISLMRIVDLSYLLLCYQTVTEKCQVLSALFPEYWSSFASTTVLCSLHCFPFVLSIKILISITKTRPDFIFYLYNFLLSYILCLLFVPNSILRKHVPQYSSTLLHFPWSISKWTS